MPRKDKNVPKMPNVPWLTKDGYLDLNKLPIDSVLTQAVGDNEEQFRSACRVLASMVSAGRTEAGVFLYGLLRFCGDNRVKKESVVEALGTVRTHQSADLLFEELKKTESSNSTRGYLNAVLKALRRMPLELVRDGFENLLCDSKWSYRMKRKFEDVLAEMEYRNWR